MCVANLKKHHLVFRTCISHVFAVRIPLEIYFEWQAWNAQGCHVSRYLTISWFSKNLWFHRRFKAMWKENRVIFGT